LDDILKVCNFDDPRKFVDCMVWSANPVLMILVPDFVRAMLRLLLSNLTCQTMGESDWFETINL